MIPCVYPPTETRFVSSGLGYLPDCLSCTITEEHNSIFELELEYPINGSNYESLKKFNIILAKANDVTQAQPFDIYSIEEDSQSAKVRARHIGFRMEYIPCVPVETSNLGGLCSQLYSNNPYASNYGSEYQFNFNKVSESYVQTTYSSETIKSQRAVLKEAQEHFDTDFWLDRFNVYVGWRGRRDGLIYRAGINLVDLEREVGTEGAFNSVVALWYQQNQGIAGGRSALLTSDIPYPRTLILDVTSEYQTKPSEAGVLTPRANQELAKHDMNGSFALDVKLATVNKADIFHELEKVGVGDYVRVYHKKLGINVELRVVKLVYDALTETATSVSIGNYIKDLSNTIAEMR